MHQWKSYDNKWVRRNPVDKLPELRINEILNSFGKAVDPLFEMQFGIMLLDIPHLSIIYCVKAKLIY